MLRDTHLDRYERGPHAHDSSIHIDQLGAEADEIIIIFIDNIHQLQKQMRSSSLNELGAFVTIRLMLYLVFQCGQICFQLLTEHLQRDLFQARSVRMCQS